MLLSAKKIVGFKTETTAGSAESITATECAYNVFNARMSNSFAFMRRPGAASFAPRKGVVGPAFGSISFTMELYGSASWASTLLPACGYVLDSTTYKPKSEPPGSNTKTITIAFYEDGRCRQLYGCAGSFRINLTSGGLATAEFNFSGIYSAPTDASLPAADFPSYTPLLFNGAGLTLGTTEWGTGSTKLRVSSLSIDAGNAVEPRQDVHATSGVAHFHVAHSLVTGSMDPEVTTVANHAIWSEITASTETALTVTLGSTGNLVTLSVPKLQWTNQDDGDRSGILTDNMTFEANQSADAGDDNFTISFAG